MATFEKKLSISLGSAVLFILTSLPQTYLLTDRFLPDKLFDKRTNCPTLLGRLVHTAVFFALTYLSMGSVKKHGLKLKYSIYTALIYFFLTSPELYAAVGFADYKGCPTFTGILVHAVVYTAALVGVMYLPEY